MDDNNKFLNFIKKQYEIYKASNYESLVDYCYSYGTRVNEYKKDITLTAKKIMDNIISVLNGKNIKYSYKQYKKSIRVNIIFEYKNYPASGAKIYIPVFVENSFRISNILLNYIINNKINCNIKVSTINKSDLLVINLFDFKEAKNFSEFYFKNDELIKDIKNKIIEFIPQMFGVGICTEFYPYNYIDFFNDCLCSYFKNINNVEEIDLKLLINYLKDLYKKEKRILKKEMFLIIIKSIEIINEGKDPIKVFEYNEDMNIGSFDSANHNVLLDENKLIYFENKERTLLFLFGTEDYLNLCYSKFYKNVIEKNPSNLYYTFFKNIYRKILEGRYSNIEEIFEINESQDIIYQELMLMASGYFAYRKMNFEFDSVNLILKKVLENKLNCRIDYTEKETESKNEKKYIFPFNIEYGNKVIELKDGKLSTIFNYFRSNKILEYIPIDSTVNLINGESIKGEEFLRNLYKYIPDYNTFQELISDKVALIEFNN